eukprot:Transcript_10977.p1 GENE.Transcript_10977~~Transcript_10977.p1  ORF type:complete len:366 (-),score=55.70 Transcript_10977:558-1655(-)
MASACIHVARVWRLGFSFGKVGVPVPQVDAELDARLDVRNLKRKVVCLEDLDNLEDVASLEDVQMREVVSVAPLLITSSAPVTPRHRSDTGAPPTPEALMPRAQTPRGQEVPLQTAGYADNTAGNPIPTVAMWQPPTTRRPERALKSVSWRMLEGMHYLGAGEFCTCWGATLDGKPVAVKALREEHNGSALAVNDLERELQIMRAIDHAGIVKVLGVGRTKGYNAPFLVLEQLKETLTAALPKPSDQVSFWERRSMCKRWPLSRALHVGFELAEALRYCHDEAVPGFRLMHRDLKPDNIGFLDDGRLVLFDFGLGPGVPSNSEPAFKPFDRTTLGALAATLWKMQPGEPRHAVRKLTGQTGSARE